MKITPNVLSIPPYISTSWENISSMHVKEEAGVYRLIILLKVGPQVEIPGLGRAAIDAIFNAHVQYVETPAGEVQPPLSFSLPLKNDGEGATIDAFGPMTQHDPDQADLPPLPSGILKKIGAIASALGVDSIPSLPKAEPGCNCIYCQVMSALQTEGPEEEVTEADLKFRNWEVAQTANKLYIVTNPIDTNEHYSVFLGEPIGCTCGHINCEHVRAVLST